MNQFLLCWGSVSWTILLARLDLNFEQYILRLTEMTPNFCVQQKHLEWSLSSKKCQIMCKNMQHTASIRGLTTCIYLRRVCNPQTFYNIHAVHRSMCLRKGPIYVVCTYMHHICNHILCMHNKKHTMCGSVFKWKIYIDIYIYIYII